jgi:hypothetical protein
MCARESHHEMRIKASLIILLLLQNLGSGAAQARDERCKAPPYGASMEAYNVFVADARQIDKADGRSAGKPSSGALDLLANTCEMKYGAGDRTELYRVGFTPEDFDRMSTVMLTSEYLGVMKYVAFQQLAHGERAVTPGAGVQPTSDYQSVSVQDFATVGPRLAAENAKVTLTGAYILQGDRGMLYADIPAVVKTKYGPQTGTQPSVPLLTDAASGKFRRRILSCQTDPSASQVGCNITLRGQVTLCTPTHGGSEVPCVNVEDGK